MVDPRARLRMRLAICAVAVPLAAAGCASGPGQPNADTRAPSPEGRTVHGSHHSHGRESQQAGRPAAPADVTLSVTVKDGEMNPPPRRVPVQRGQTLRLVVRSDHADHVHVHGYDLEKQVTPHRPAVVTFTADQVGVFSVETHHTGLQLAQLQVE